MKTKPVFTQTLLYFGLRNIEEEKFGENTKLVISGGRLILSLLKQFLFIFRKIVEIGFYKLVIYSLIKAWKLQKRKNIGYIEIPKIIHSINYIKTQYLLGEKKQSKG